MRSFTLVAAISSALVGLVAAAPAAYCTVEVVTATLTPTETPTETPTATPTATISGPIVVPTTTSAIVYWKSSSEEQTQCEKILLQRMYDPVQNAYYEDCAALSSEWASLEGTFNIDATKADKNGFFSLVKSNTCVLAVRIREEKHTTPCEVTIGDKDVKKMLSLMLDGSTGGTNVFNGGTAYCNANGAKGELLDYKLYDPQAEVNADANKYGHATNTAAKPTNTAGNAYQQPTSGAENEPTITIEIPSASPTSSITSPY